MGVVREGEMGVVRERENGDTKGIKNQTIQ